VASHGSLTPIQLSEFPVRAHGQAVFAAEQPFDLAQLPGADPGAPSRTTGRTLCSGQCGLLQHLPLFGRVGSATAAASVPGAVRRAPLAERLAGHAMAGQSRQPGNSAQPTQPSGRDGPTTPAVSGSENRPLDRSDRDGGSDARPSSGQTSRRAGIRSTERRKSHVLRGFGASHPSRLGRRTRFRRLPHPGQSPGKSPPTRCRGNRKLSNESTGGSRTSASVISPR
jgi:hypothetical protein